MALEMKLTGTVTDMIGHLRQQAAEQVTLAKSMGGAEKARRNGIAEGLEQAASVLGNWEQPVSANGKDGEARQPAWGSTPNA